MSVRTLFDIRTDDRCRESGASFYSDHTSTAFALLLATACVGHLNGHRFGHWFWLVGLPASVTTSYLRVATDQHYLTDVLVGAGMGAAVGWFTPRLRQRSTARRLTVTPIATTTAPELTVNLAW